MTPPRATPRSGRRRCRWRTWTSERKPFRWRWPSPNRPNGPSTTIGPAGPPTRCCPRRRPWSPPAAARAVAAGWAAAWSMSLASTTSSPLTRSWTTRWWPRASATAGSADGPSAVSQGREPDHSPGSATTAGHAIRLCLAWPRARWSPTSTRSQAPSPMAAWAGSTSPSTAMCPTVPLCSRAC